MSSDTGEADDRLGVNLRLAAGHCGQHFVQQIAYRGAAVDADTKQLKEDIRVARRELGAKRRALEVIRWGIIDAAAVHAGMGSVSPHEGECTAKGKGDEEDEKHGH